MSDNFDDLATETSEEKKGGNRFLKIGGIGCGVLLVLCIGFGGIAFYFSQQQIAQFMDSAAENRTAGNYEAALASLDELIETYPDSEEAAEARTMLPEINLEWGINLNESGEYTAAQEKLETLMAQESGDIAAQAFANLAFSHIGLAEQATAANDIPTAYAEYTYVFDNYEPGAGRDAAVTSFQTNFTAPLLTFGQEQESANVFSDASLAYSAINTHAPDSVEAAQARGALPNALYQWGLQLVAEEDFEGAITNFETVVNEYASSAVAADAAAALVDARVAAVAASGAAGALPPPQASGQGDGSDTATYDVENDTVCPILLLASGPGSQSLQIPAGQTIQREFVPGTYNIVVQTDDSVELSTDCQNIIPFTGESIFEGGFIYESSFYIEIE